MFELHPWLRKIIFLETPVNKWFVKVAFEEIERNNPSSQARSNLRSLRESIIEALASTNEEGEALLIIENIRPYLTHCLVSKIDIIKYDW